MPASHAQHHLLALQTALECAAFGARIRTIQMITGLSHNLLCELCFEDRSRIPRGRPPDTPEWYHTTNLLNRVEASMAAALYSRLRDLDFEPAPALLAAYKQYRSVRRLSQITFDRTFDLAAHLDGVWLKRSKSFSLARCPTCASQYLTSICLPPHSNHECPFCKLLVRHRCDPRVKQSFPLRSPHSATSGEIEHLVYGASPPPPPANVESH